MITKERLSFANKLLNSVSFYKQGIHIKYLRYLIIEDIIIDNQLNEEATMKSHTLHNRFRIPPKYRGHSPYKYNQIF